MLLNAAFDPNRQPLVGVQDQSKTPQTITQSTGFETLIAPENSESSSREAVIARTNAEVMAKRDKVDPVADFLAFMEKTPTERMRELILKEMGLTEESLAALPPEERQKIEEQIAAMIEERMQQQTEEKLEEYTLKAKIAQLSHEHGQAAGAQVETLAGLSLQVKQKAEEELI